MNETVIDRKDAIFVIDSCGWIEYFLCAKDADEFGVYIENAAPDRYFTSVITIYEVYKKIFRDVSEEEALKAVAHIKRLTTTVAQSEELAIVAAEISATENIPMADAMIYATAMTRGALLVTGDKDLRDMADVVYIGKK